MKCTITITTDDPTELSRLICAALAAIEEGETNGPLIDCYGARVGTFRIEQDECDRVYQHLLKQGAAYIDEIAGATGISVHHALSAVTILELKGKVRQFSGKRFAVRQ